jgi:hypothetical protein
MNDRTPLGLTEAEIAFAEKLIRGYASQARAGRFWRWVPLAIAVALLGVGTVGILCLAHLWSANPLGILLDGVPLTPEFVRTYVDGRLVLLALFGTFLLPLGHRILVPS